MIKPEAVAANNIGGILKMIEKGGFRIVAMKKVQLSKKRASEFYAVHKEKPFYGELVSYMSSGPIVAAILEKDNAVADFRALIGATDPAESANGTIRKEFAESKGYSIVKDFCGHGIGKTFHAPPNILHYGKRGQGVTLVEGMFFTIEPKINIGKKDVLILEDGWTAVTRDKKLSAQYEHTIGVTKTGYEIFTISAREKKEGKIFSC